MRILILFSFLLLTNFASATNPISVESYYEEIASEESANQLVKWWKIEKAKITPLANGTLYASIVSVILTLIARFTGFIWLNLLGYGLMILSLVLGVIVLFSKDKTADNYRKSRLKAIIGIVISSVMILGTLLTSLLWWGF